MQLKIVVLPAPFGPIKPTISNSSTFNETSDRACRPPKRIDTPAASRTGMEPLSLEPPPDRRSDRAEPIGLEDQCHDGEGARKRLDDQLLVVLDELDTEEVGQVRQVLAPEDVEQRERHDPA